MGFLQPLVLLGLVAAGIPALLHLLERRTPPELDFPAVRYLAEAERRHAHRLRLRHLLLLLLRTGLVVLVVLAAARPVAPAGRAAAGMHAPTALAIVLDNSLSSGAVRDGTRALDRYRALARATLSEAAAGDRLWLILADGVVRRGSREALLTSVEGAEAAPLRLDVSAAVSQAARAIADDPLPREVHVLSDLQATALGWANVPPGIRVLALEPPGRQPPENRGVDSAMVRDGALAVAIGGSRDAAAGAFRVTLAGAPVGQGMAAAGAGATVSLEDRSGGPPGLEGRWLVGEVELEADELLADNRRTFVWRSLPPARVRADPSAGPFVRVALEVLRDAKRVLPGDAAGVGLGARVAPGRTVVFPPEDPARIGEVNRALAARGVRWRFTPGGGSAGRVEAKGLRHAAGVEILQRLAVTGGDSSDVLATVGGSAWLVRSGEVLLVGSRLEPEWTPLPTTPEFVPFLDELVNRLARGEAPVRAEEGAPAVRFERSPAGDTVGAVVLGHDPRESDLRPATGDALPQGLGGEPVLVSADRWESEDFGGGRRTEITGLVLVLALLIAAAEWGVAALYR